MKLLTHNFLSCNVKGVKNGWPLGIDAQKVEVREADMDPGVRLLTASPVADRFDQRRCDSLRSRLQA